MEIKNKNAKIALTITFLIVVIVIVAIFWPEIFSQKPVKTQVPNEFILSNDKASVEKIYQDYNDVDFARYMVNQSPQEVYDYFFNKLQNEKWEIIVNTGIKENDKAMDGIIFGKKQNYEINVYIEKAPDAKTTKVEVTFIPH